MAFTDQLTPNLAGAMAPGAVVVDRLDLLAVNDVPLGPVAGQIRVTGNGPVVV